MTDGLRGVIAMAVACVIWGLSPLFYKLLADVPPLEVLAHRTIWSLFAILAALVATRQVPSIGRALLGRRRRLRILAAALLISLNWFGFIFAVQTDRALESSLGYYIFPLVAVALGRLVFADQLRLLQWLAVGLAAVAVSVLTIGLGVVPGIALLLAISFGLYGVCKRGLDTGALASVGAEVLLLAPVALLFLAGLHAGGGAAVGLAEPTLLALLVLSGPLTGMPLLLFAYAAQRVRLPTLGLVQYLNPSLQLAVAALIFLEPVTRWHAAALPLIWLALALYSLDSYRAGAGSRPAGTVTSGGPGSMSEP